MQKVNKLHLYKERFKFSAAHFLIFDSKRAERLHGHNYKVKVRIECDRRSPNHQDRFGYQLDFSWLKRIIQEQVDALDELVLLPKDHPEIQTEEEGEDLKLSFRERRYIFPKNEVLLLPITNTSVEELSDYLVHKLAAELQKHKLAIQEVSLTVEESEGQAAETLVRL